MAAAVASPPTIDLGSQVSYPVRLGASILKPADARRYTSVRYNYKPSSHEGRAVESTVRTAASQATHNLELSLKDGDEEYRYYGREARTEGSDQYVLLVRGSGREREVVLERLAAHQDFNLARLPDGKNVWKLRQPYPHLPEDDASDYEDLKEDDHPAEAPLDADNPFDYRHYITSPAEPAPRSKAIQTSSTVARSPASQQQLARTTPQTTPVKRSDNVFIAPKKRKAQESGKANPKRVKAGTEPPPAATKPTTAPKSKPDIPRVRMDRKASLHLQPFDDLGELVVDDETPVLEKPKSAMSLALTGQLGQGPISLHSAASPASRVASPAAPRPERFDDEEEFELGGSSPEYATKPRRDRAGHDEEEDADADVEDLELPSPAQLPRARQMELDEVVDDGDHGSVDDYDDLDEQLARAMAEEDEGDVAPVVAQHESEEESEEE